MRTHCEKHLESLLASIMGNKIYYGRIIDKEVSTQMGSTSSNEKMFISGYEGLLNERFQCCPLLSQASLLMRFFENPSDCRILMEGSPSLSFQGVQAFQLQQVLSNEY
jgi:hypothetical protein